MWSVALGEAAAPNSGQISERDTQLRAVLLSALQEDRLEGTIWAESTSTITNVTSREMGSNIRHARVGESVPLQIS